MGQPSDRLDCLLLNLNHRSSKTQLRQSSAVPGKVYYDGTLPFRPFFPSARIFFSGIFHTGPFSPVLPISGKDAKLRLFDTFVSPVLCRSLFGLWRKKRWRKKREV